MLNPLMFTFIVLACNNNLDYTTILNKEKTIIL